MKKKNEKKKKKIDKKNFKIQKKIFFKNISWKKLFGDAKTNLVYNLKQEVHRQINKFIIFQIFLSFFRRSEIFHLGIKMQFSTIFLTKLNEEPNDIFLQFFFLGFTRNILTLNLQKGFYNEIIFSSSFRLSGYSIRVKQH